MAASVGLDAKAYYNEGTYAAPDWTEITAVRDINFNLEKGKADTSSRGNEGWKTYKATLKDASIEMTLVWDTSDASFAALQGAFFDGTQIEVLILDGPVTTSGSEGLRATMEVFSFSRGEPLEDTLTANVTLAPSKADNNPEWYTAVGS